MAKVYKKRAKPIIGRKLKRLQGKARQTARKHIKTSAKPLAPKEKADLQAETNAEPTPAPTEQSPEITKAASQKASEVEYEDRLNIIVTRLIEGCKRRDIIAYVAKKAWTITADQVDEYIKAGRKILLEEYQEDRTNKVARNEARLDTIYRTAMALKNIPAALAAIKEQNHMLGVGDNQTQNVKISADKAVMDQLDKIAEASKAYIAKFSHDPNKDTSFLEDEPYDPSHTPDQLH